MLYYNICTTYYNRGDIMRKIRYICERYNINEIYMLDESNMTVSDKFGNIINGE